MKIAISNRQTRVKLHPPALRHLARDLMERARRLNPARTWHDILVMVTDDRGIQAVNLNVFGRNRTTDVISLSYAPMPPESEAWSAELVVNVQRAQEESARLGSRWSFEQELALYIAHGCDHLQGEDDADDTGRNRMRRRELSWVRAIRKGGHLTGLLA